MSGDKTEAVVKAGDAEAMPAVRASALSADRVYEATASLPEDQRGAIRWLFSHMRLENLSLRETADLIHYNGSALHRAFHNKYGADLGKMCADINSFRRVVEARASVASAGFVETSIARKVWQAADWALVSNSIVFVYGDSQIGKTTVLEEYTRRHNHGTTRMFRMPSTAGVQLMLKTIAVACAINPDTSFDALRDRILKVLDKNTLLIADEVHQTFQSYHKNARVTCLELLREFHDRTGCGMVLCGTNVLKKEIQQGRHKEMLEQLNRRGVVQLQLPNRPPKRDIDAVARAYKMPPPEGVAEELVKEIITESGLGKLIKFIQAGTRLAAKRNETFGWKHVISAHDILARLSEPSA